MRIRGVWVAVPACAAAGAVSYSLVAAQEQAPPAGYYQPRVQPMPPGVMAQPQYIRPSGTPGSARSAPPAADAPPPITRVGYQAPPEPKPRVNQPVVLGPAPTNPALPKPQPLQPPAPVRQVGGSEPSIPPPPKFFPEAVPSPTLPTPTVKADPPAVGPRVETPPAEPPKPLPNMPPPKVVESGVVDVPKPLPLNPQPGGPVPLTPSPAAALPPIAAPAVTPSQPPAFTATAPLAPSAAPAVTIAVDAPKEVSVGQNLTYELVVRNTGPVPVANVRIEDELPAGAALVGSEPAAEQGGGRLAWAVGVLEPNGEKRVKITVKPADEGEVRSRPVVTFSAAAEARVKVTRPRVAVAVTATESARVGDEVTFQIRVANTGTGTAARTVVQARLGDGLHRPEGSVIEAELKDLPPGQEKTVTLRVLATKAGSHACAIAATADGVTIDPAKAAVAVVEPLLQMKLVGPTRCLVRTEPEFRVELSNPGSAPTDPVQVWAVVPEGFEFASAGDGGMYQPGNRTVVWRLPALPAGGTRGVAVKLRATAPADGGIKVVAQAGGADGVVQAGGRSARVLEAKADAAIKAEGVPGLRFEVTDVDDPVEVGKEALYEIKVVNQGTAACTNVSVSAVLADGTTATAAQGPTAGRGANQQVSFDPLPTLAVKGEAVFRVRVKGGQPGDQKFRVQVACDQIRTPIVKEENTRFYKD